MSTTADTITATLAGNLRRIREQRGLSQVALGEIAGCTGPWVSHIECGRREVPMTAVIQIAEALKVSPRALLLPPDCAECGDLPRPGFLCIACGKGERRAS